MAQAEAIAARRLAEDQRRRRQARPSDEVWHGCGHGHGDSDSTHGTSRAWDTSVWEDTIGEDGERHVALHVKNHDALEYMEHHGESALLLKFKSDEARELLRRRILGLRLPAFAERDPLDRL